MCESAQVALAVRSIERQLSAAGGPEGASVTPEELALAALALESHGADGPALRPIRRALAIRQGPRGELLVAPLAPGVYWPTAWAILAWRNAPEFEDHRRRAVGFLLEVSGEHWPRGPHPALGHDTMLRGWPWTGGTHSWVQPTSVTLLALEAQPQGDEERVAQAVAMLLDRQLPGGGWNYGNTRVFQNVLRPIPEDSGYALAALRPRVERPRVESSLEYLAATVPGVRAPAALAWSVLGLAAWGAPPPDANGWIEESLARQSRIGPYPLRYLAQLVLAARLETGLASLFREKG